MLTTGMFEAMATALGTIGQAMYPDSVTFRRPVSIKGPDMGNLVVATGNPTNPQNIPVRYRIASGEESQRAEQTVSTTAYMLMIPNQFKNALVDVDGSCLAIIAARDGGEEAKTLNVLWIGRIVGIEIAVLASLVE